MATALLLGGCAHDKEAWLKDLPVEAQTSINGVRHQDIRLLQLYESKEVSGQQWLRGKGYAEVNDRTQKYFWQSKEMPNLEITITKADSDAFKQCQILLDQMPTKKRGVQILGEGLFSAKGNEDEGFIGIFRIDHITQCTLGPKVSPVGEG